MKNMNTNKKLVLSGVSLALGFILPFFTGQIPQIGKMLLPMHIPVIFCGYVCGGMYGFAVGLFLPLLRFFLFGMPQMPMALTMSIELAVYGAMTGFLYRHIRSKKKIYLSLILSMLAGRAAWGIASVLIYGLSDMCFTWQLFIAGAFLNSIPGIILQLVLIPVLVTTLERAGVTTEYEYCQG